MSSKISLLQFLVFLLDALGNNNPKTKDSAVAKLDSVLGSNWAMLPVNSFTMLAVIMVLTQVLEPLGITPKNIALTAIELAEQLGESDAAKEVGEKIKNTAKLTTEMLEQAFQKINLEQATENIKKNLDKVATKTKKAFGSLSKIKNNKKEKE